MPEQQIRVRDGEIVETVKRVDGTLTVVQRWGGMIGTLVIIAFYGGVNAYQFKEMRDDIRELKEARKSDDKEKGELKTQVAQQQTFINDYMKIDHLYLDKLRVEREARLQNEEQQKRRK